MSIHYADDQITLYHGDALDVARTLPDNAADCIVTSPPYYGLRDYDDPGQYGLEDTPAGYVYHLLCLFAELRRVLADDGTCWVVIGDSYARDGDDRPLKSLLGMPWRVATNDPEYKLNNNYRAYYARLMMYREADLMDVFDIRDSEADDWLANLIDMEKHGGLW